MTGWTTPLGVGSSILHDGARFAVIELSGRRVLLAREGTNEVRQVDIAWLLNQPHTRLADTAPQPACGIALSGLDPDTERNLAQRVAHVQEVLTGYRSGSGELALPEEPRASYRPGTAMMARYQAKAAEIGVAVSTLRRWVAQFRQHGPYGLLHEAGGPKGGRTDPRWVDTCRTVLNEHVRASRPTRAVILAEVSSRLEEEYGRDVVPVPARSAGYEMLARLSRGTNAFDGATKGKRSIANRPQGVYGRLRATRPGEYVLLDTTPLDVFAMEPVTCRWVQAELTVAMDLYTRCICGLCLTPVSTKAVDVAGVLYETLRPRTDRAGAEGLPYHGVPATVVVPADKLVDDKGRTLLPSVAAETIVYDHGQIYLSRNVESVCTKFGISLQPARPRTPTDKSPVERWFRTLAESLLVALPGYKGSDVHGRGLDVEQQAFFFLDEIEEIIREWVRDVYHQRPHRGVCVPEVPGLDMSPLDMFSHGLHRAGHLTVPSRPDLAYDFLPIMWTTIQHYGVEIATLRYNGSALLPYRNQKSPHGGMHAGKWPISLDPGDVSRVYFQDPADSRWHTLTWEHAEALGRPFSAEALEYARRLAAKTSRFPDTRHTLTDLLDRWGAGLTANAAERRMAIRLSQDRLRLLGPDTDESAANPADDVSALASVRRITALHSVATTPDRQGEDHATALRIVTAADEPSDEPPGGDDDSDDDLDDTDQPDTNEAFYADVMDSA